MGSNGVFRGRACTANLTTDSIAHGKVTVYAPAKLKLAHLSVLRCAANFNLDDLVLLNAANRNNVTVWRSSQLVDHCGLQAIDQRKGLATLRGVVVSASLVV